MSKHLSKEEILDRLERIYYKLEPLHALDSADFANVIKTYEDMAALLILGHAFARATPARENFTDAELTELEAHADRLIKICPIEAEINPVESV